MTIWTHVHVEVGDLRSQAGGLPTVGEVAGVHQLLSQLHVGDGQAEPHAQSQRARQETRQVVLGRTVVNKTTRKRRYILTATWERYSQQLNAASDIAIKEKDRTDCCQNNRQWPNMS